MHNHDEFENNNYERPSKSQLKREMTALQDLGEQLLTLSKDKLKQLDLHTELYAAIEQAQSITSREAKRRHLQYIGKLMRKADTDQIKASLNTWQDGSKQQVRDMHKIESIRDQLVVNDNVLTSFLQEYPNTNVQELRAQIRAARKESQQNESINPASGQQPKRKHYRALFQTIKNICEEQSSSQETNQL